MKKSYHPFARPIPLGVPMKIMNIYIGTYIMAFPNRIQHQIVSLSAGIGAENTNPYGFRIHFPAGRMWDFRDATGRGKRSLILLLFIVFSIIYIIVKINVVSHSFFTVSSALSRKALETSSSGLFHPRGSSVRALTHSFCTWHDPYQRNPLTAPIRLILFIVPIKRQNHFPWLWGS